MRDEVDVEHVMYAIHTPAARANAVVSLKKRLRDCTLECEQLQKQASRLKTSMQRMEKAIAWMEAKGGSGNGSKTADGLKKSKP